MHRVGSGGIQCGRYGLERGVREVLGAGVSEEARGEDAQDCADLAHGLVEGRVPAPGEDALVAAPGRVAGGDLVGERLLADGGTDGVDGGALGRLGGADEGQGGGWDALSEIQSACRGTAEAHRGQLLPRRVIKH